VYVYALIWDGSLVFKALRVLESHDCMCCVLLGCSDLYLKLLITAWMTP
jgi:hypothetical protein